MARQVDPKMAEEVVRAIEKHPDGATIEQVETALKVPRRTLQRRLAELVSAGGAFVRSVAPSSAAINSSL